MGGSYVTGLVGLAFTDEVSEPTVRRYLGTWVVVVPRSDFSLIVAEVESEWLAHQVVRLLRQERGLSSK